MTLNWGHKLLLVFAAFAVMMSYLVYQCMHTRFDLVSKEYYKDELQYQQVIDGAKRASTLSSAISITEKEGTVILHLPAEMKQHAVTGNSWFYCADDARKDRKIPLQANTEAEQYIDHRQLLPGNYTVKVSWTMGDQQYYSEQYTTIH